MLNTCTACSQFVFNSNKVGHSQTQFYQHLSLAPRLFDGTRSNAPTSVLCGLASGVAGLSKWLFCGPPVPPAGTVSQFIAGKLTNGQTHSAVTQTPSDSGEGIMTFFDPLVICNVTQPGAQATLNEAMLFHEALHGDYGSQDPDLERLFDETTDVGITYYMENNVFGLSLRYLHDSPTDPEPLQCPSSN